MAHIPYAEVSWKRMSRVHLRDLIEVGLVDDPWLDQVPATLRSRLQQLFDNPED